MLLPCESVRCRLVWSYMAEIRGAEHWDQWPTLLSVTQVRLVSSIKALLVHMAVPKQHSTELCLSFPTPAKMETQFLFQIFCICLKKCCYYQNCCLWSLSELLILHCSMVKNKALFVLSLCPLLAPFSRGNENYIFLGGWFLIISNHLTILLWTLSIPNIQPGDN